MSRSRWNGRAAPRSQRGAVLFLILLVTLTGSAYTLLKRLNETVVRQQQADQTFQALRRAKEALIGYAVAYPDHNTGVATQGPGNLPCPDRDSDGQKGLAGQPQTCAQSSNTHVGRLPIVDLGLPDLVDSSGQRLWYVLSDNFRESQGAPINSETPGEITLLLDDAGTQLTDIVALVFAPGAPFGQVNRVASPEDRTQFLEGENSANDDFIFAGDGVTGVNDRVIAITRGELMGAVERRVVRDVARILADNGGRVTGNTYDLEITSISSAITSVPPVTAPIGVPSSESGPQDDACVRTPFAINPLLLCDIRQDQFDPAFASFRPLACAFRTPRDGGIVCDWSGTASTVLYQEPLLGPIFTVSTRTGNSIGAEDNRFRVTVEFAVSRADGIDPAAPLHFGWDIGLPGNILFNQLPNLTVDLNQTRDWVPVGLWAFLGIPGVTQSLQLVSQATPLGTAQDDFSLAHRAVAAPTSVMPAWFDANDWERVVFILRSASEILQDDTLDCVVGEDCLVIEDRDSLNNTLATDNDVRLAVIAAGPPLPTQTRAAWPPTTATDYFELENGDDLGDALFQRTRRNPAFNDYIEVVLP